MNDMYRQFQENANFLKAIFKKFLLCAGRWEDNYKEIIGTKFHYLNSEWQDEYIKYDGDVFECFILTEKDELVKFCFLYSDFKKWQEKRHRDMRTIL